MARHDEDRRLVALNVVWYHSLFRLPLHGMITAWRVSGAQASLVVYTVHLTMVARSPVLVRQG